MCCSEHLGSTFFVIHHSLIYFFFFSSLKVILVWALSPLAKLSGECGCCAAYCWCIWCSQWLYEWLFFTTTPNEGVYLLYVISVYRCDWIGIVSVEAVLMWMCYVSAYIRWQCAELTFNQEFRRRDLSGWTFFSPILWNLCKSVRCVFGASAAYSLIWDLGTNTG